MAGNSRDDSAGVVLFLVANQGEGNKNKSVWLTQQPDIVFAGPAQPFSLPT